MYVNDSMHFLTGDKLEILNCILNSKLYSWLLKLIVGHAVGGNAGHASNVKDLFICKVPKIQEQQLINLNMKISLNLEHGIDTSALKQEIDEIVYRLYNLTPDEIKIIDTGYQI